MYIYIVYNIYIYIIYIIYIYVIYIYVIYIYVIYIYIHTYYPMILPWSSHNPVNPSTSSVSKRNQGVFNDLCVMLGAGPRKMPRTWHGFISWKMPRKLGWELGVALWLRKPPEISFEDLSQRNWIKSTRSNESQLRNHFSTFISKSLHQQQTWVSFHRHVYMIGTAMKIDNVWIPKHGRPTNSTRHKKNGEW